MRRPGYPGLLYPYQGKRSALPLPSAKPDVCRVSRICRPGAFFYSDKSTLDLYCLSVLSRNDQLPFGANQKKWGICGIFEYIYGDMAGTDLELWQEILAGNSRAWEALVRRYQALIYTIATRAGLSLDDAADCFQQTWVVLYDHRHKVKDPSRLSAWLVTTAKREALRLRRLAVRSGDAGDRVDRPDPDPLPDDAMLRLEQQANLEIAIGNLKPQCQRVVEAFFFAPDDRTYDQIAESLGIAPNSLGPIRRRCLERLKSILVKNGYLDVRDGGKVTL